MYLQECYNGDGGQMMSCVIHIGRRAQDMAKRIYMYVLSKINWRVHGWKWLFGKQCLKITHWNSSVNFWIASFLMAFGVRFSTSRKNSPKSVSWRFNLISGKKDVIACSGEVSFGVWLFWLGCLPERFVALWRWMYSLSVRKPFL